MRPSRRSARIAIVGALTILAALIPAGSASAATLNGEWAPLTRCPVDAPAMLAADGSNTAPLCLASRSTNGSIKIGNDTATTAASEVQLGLLNSGSGTQLIQPSDGSIHADPVRVPGGLLRLMCPSEESKVAELCRKARDSRLNTVFASVEPAGDARDFDLGGALGVGRRILTVPIKIRLDNPLLASTCTIGTDDDPIVLNVKNLTAPTATFTRFDGDGTPNPNGELLRIATTATQGDDSFAVPGHSGCGKGSLINAALNRRTGVPAPAGNNFLVLNDAVSSLVGFNNARDFAPNAGQQLSAFWHSAVQS